MLGCGTNVTQNYCCDMSGTGIDTRAFSELTLRARCYTYVRSQVRMERESELAVSDGLVLWI